MKRHNFVYLFISLFIGLTMALFVFGSLPLAANEISNAPVGLTETFTPPPTNTSVPVVTNTPVPAATNTPVPIATNTPVPAATNTPVPALTNTPVPAPTNTSVPIETSTSVPVATNTPAPVETSTSVPVDTSVRARTSVLTDTQTALAVVGLPNTGGGASQSGASPWVLVLLAGIVGSLGALLFRLNRRAYRPTRR